MKDARPLWVRMFDFGLEHKGFCTVGGGPDRHCNCGLSELRAELNAALASPPQIAQPEQRYRSLLQQIENILACPSSIDIASCDHVVTAVRELKEQAEKWFSIATAAQPLQVSAEQLARQIFFHVLLNGGEDNPFKSIRNEWFTELAAPKIVEVLGEAALAATPQLPDAVNDEPSEPMSPEAVKVLNSIVEARVPEENFIRDESEAAPPLVGPQHLGTGTHDRISRKLASQRGNSQQ